VHFFAVTAALHHLVASGMLLTASCRSNYFVELIVWTDGNDKLLENCLWHNVLCIVCVLFLFECFLS